MYKIVTLASTPISSYNLPHVGGGDSTITTIFNIIFNIGGALALLVIVVSGLRYILSTGNPERTAKAKNGVIYALVGLVLLLFSRAIVLFVVNRI